MRTIRLRRGSWVIAAIGAFALAAVFLGYGAVSAEGDPPVAPASLSAVRHDGNIEIRFSHPNVANVDGWQVQTRAGNAAWGDWYELTGVGPNAGNANIEGTDNDTHYRIRLRAVNEHGAGPYVKTVARSNNRAAAPANMRVELGSSSSQLYLVWKSSNDDAITGYQHRFRQAGGAWSDWTDSDHQASGSSQYITFDDLSAGTEYQFKLRAMRGQAPGYVGKASGTTSDSTED